MSDLVSIKVVAAHLDMSPRTIYDWAAEGKIPARRIGNVYRFDLEEIDRWVEARRIGPKLPARKTDKGQPAAASSAP